ncbi:MAG: M67 family metallopeptidase [Actinomycetota bacterium]|nr:M67 family metallopeptidase [Actinomycetota bacterium]
MLAASVHEQIIAAGLDAWPLEACGLLAGPPPRGDGTDATVEAHHPTENASRSSRVYSIAPLHLLRADRAAEEAGMALLGVWHTHTHTDAWPSPTDVAQAPDPAWHYVLISLRDTHPVARSYRIRDGQIEEEPVALQW